MALRVSGMCFWAAKTRRNLNFLRCIHVFDLVLKYCSDINENNWSQLFFYTIVLTDIAALILGMSFVSVFLVLNWNLFVWPCHRTVCSWNPKRKWPRLGFFRRFCWNMPHFDDLISAWTKFFMNCFLINLLVTTSKFFDFSFEANSGLFFNYAWTF